MSKENKEKMLPLVGNDEHAHGEHCCSHDHDHDDVEGSIEEVLGFMQDRCEDILVNIRELQDAIDDLQHLVEDDVSPVADYITELKAEFKKLSFLVDSMAYSPTETAEEGD